MSWVIKPCRRRFTDTVVGSNIYNYPEYPEHKKGVHTSRRPQRTGLIAEKAPTKVPVEYTDFAFSSDLASKLSKYIGINDHAIKLVDDYLSHPQVFPSFLTGSWTDVFDYASEFSTTWLLNWYLLLWIEALPSWLTCQFR